jgi:hypothetical protein
VVNKIKQKPIEWYRSQQCPLRFTNLFLHEATLFLSRPHIILGTRQALLSVGSVRKKLKVFGWAGKRERERRNSRQTGGEKKSLIFFRQK